MDLGHNNVGTDEGKTRKFGMKLALPKEYVKNLHSFLKGKGGERFYVIAPGQSITCRCSPSLV